MDVESLWNDLPDMSKDMVLKWAGRHNFDIQLEGTQILIYFPSLFVHDKNYHWNLWKTKRTSYVLAADLWLKGKNNEALLMVFYAAAVEECLARGLDVVTNYLSISPHLQSCRFFSFAKSYTARGGRDYI